MRVAVLATGWTGYNDAGCRQLAARGVELLVVTPKASADTGFLTDPIAEYARLHAYATPDSERAVPALVRDFAPDAVLVHSWHVPAYREALRAVGPTTLRVLWMDNVWRSTAKQWVGRAVAPWWVRRLYDVAMVPSDRTEFFARRLGFAEDEVIRGSLSADTGLFGADAVPGDVLRGRRRFLACLRLVHHKGADVLADAYRDYRASTADTWALDVVGMGPLEDRLAGLEGVRLHGFRQPAEVADLMRSASCLVVPSREEPYGVILHEGALSALPIVSTYFVGAAPLFVQDGQNGWTVPGADPAALADALRRVSSAPAERLGEMSRISRALGARTSSAGWARHLHEELVRRGAGRGVREPR